MDDSQSSNRSKVSGVSPHQNQISPPPSNGNLSNYASKRSITVQFETAYENAVSNGHTQWVSHQQKSKKNSKLYRIFQNNYLIIFAIVNKKQKGLQIETPVAGGALQPYPHTTTSATGGGVRFGELSPVSSGSPNQCTWSIILILFEISSKLLLSI